MIAVADWCLFYAFRLGSVDLSTKLVWSKLRYVGIVAVPTAWFVFALQYAGHDKWLTKGAISVLAIEPAIMLVLVWTNEYHHLFWTEISVVRVEAGFSVWRATHGIAFWFHALYSYLLVILSSLVLVQTILRSPHLYQRRVAALLAAALAPVAANVLSVTGLASSLLDLTPFGFTVAGLIVGWDLFRLRLLDTMPVAGDMVVEGLEDAVLVLDIREQIVDLNPAAERILGLSAPGVMGKRIDRVLAEERLLACYSDLQKAAPGPRAHAELDLEVHSRLQDEADTKGWESAGAKEWHQYEMRVSPVQTQRGHGVGWVVLLHDVTERKYAEEALTRQKRLFEGLVAVARAIVERPTVDATLQGALTSAANLTGAEYGTLFLLDSRSTVTHCLVIQGQTSEGLQPGAVERVMDEGMAGWVARHRQAVRIDDTQADKRWLHLPHAPSALTRSALVVPIVSGSDLLGILTLTHSQVDHFGQEDLQLIQAAADHVALALKNAQMFDSQRRAANRQNTLYQVLRSVAGQLTPDAVMQAAVESIREFAGWPNIAMILPMEDETHWEVRAACGVLSLTQGSRYAMHEGVVGRTLTTAQTQTVADVIGDPDYIMVHPDVQCELAIPLRRGERVLGVLDLESDRIGAFEPDDVLLAELLAEAIALAMDNAHLYAETQQHVSDLDALYSVFRMTGQSLSLEDVLTRALSSVILSLGFDAGLIALVDDMGSQLRLVAEHGIPSALGRVLSVDGLEGMLCDYVHRHRESLVISDLRLEGTQVFGPAVANMTAFGLRAYAGVPLLHRDVSLGAISLFAHRPRDFSVNEMALLEAIGRQVATAVANAQLFRATVSERQRLMTLIESSRDGIIFAGMDQHMLVVNVQALELLQLPGGPLEWTDRVLGEALALVVSHSPLAVQAIRNDMDRIQIGDEPAGEQELEIPPRVLHWLNLPVLADESPIGRLLVLRDVTEERLLAKMREDLTHTMVHDLRNPLTGISIALQLLDSKLSTVISPAQHRLFEIADSSTRKMIDLVNSILDVSRLERGQMPFKPAAVSLGPIISETLQLQMPLSVTKEIRLEEDVSPGLPQAWADPELVGRILQNLVGNAIKFTPAGGTVRVVARCSTVESAQYDMDGHASYLWISVHDNGPGIPPELQGRLFQQFVVGEHEQRGSGLGLSFCRLAVEAHGGRIWLESRPGQGAKLTFTLPIAHMDNETDSSIVHQQAPAL